MILVPRSRSSFMCSQDSSVITGVIRDSRRDATPRCLWHLSYCSNVVAYDTLGGDQGVDVMRGGVNLFRLNCSVGCVDRSKYF